MTLWASRDGQTVKIHGNVGLDVSVRNGHVAEYAVTEDYRHLRHFWGMLGRELDEAEKLEAEKAEKAEKAPEAAPAEPAGT
jgi:hypothetical protein